MNIISQEDIKKRIQQIQQHLVDQKADACVISSLVNLYYLNGFIFDGYMYILPDQDPMLFVKRPVDIDSDRVEYIRKPEQ